MADYVVDPTNPASPTNTQGAKQGAEEFRALKAYLLSLIPGGLGAFNFFRKNAIINGDFNVWQVGTSFVGIANNVYFADMWNYGKTGAMVHDVSRSADVPTIAQAGRLFNYSILADVTTVDAAIAAGDFCFLNHRIEGYNFLPLAQKIITLSFWVKATKTGIYSVGFRNSIADRSVAKEFTINASDTWERKTITFEASPSAGTWNYVDGIGLSILFVLAAGSDFHVAVPGTWEASDNFASANQVNGVDNVANNFRIAGVQLEAGSVATEFEQRSFPEEIALCQRYFEKSYNTDVAPGTVTSEGVEYTVLTISAGNFTQHVFSTSFKVEKRIVPAMTGYSPITGASGQFRNYATGADIAASFLGIGTKGVSLDFIVAATPTLNANGHFTANARL